MFVCVYVCLKIVEDAINLRESEVHWRNWSERNVGRKLHKYSTPLSSSNSNKEASMTIRKGTQNYHQSNEHLIQTYREVL